MNRKLTALLGDMEQVERSISDELMSGIPSDPARLETHYRELRCTLSAIRLTVQGWRSTISESK